jgi:hypothetical protein
MVSCKRQIDPKFYDSKWLLQTVITVLFITIGYHTGVIMPYSAIGKNSSRNLYNRKKRSKTAISHLIMLKQIGQTNRNKDCHLTTL